MPATAGSRSRIRLVIEPTSFREPGVPPLFTHCDFRNNGSQRAKVGHPRVIRPHIGLPHGLSFTAGGILIGAVAQCHRRKQIAPYIEHGRKVSRPAVRRGARTAASRQRSSDIRAWAMEQGITVSGRGRIPASVIEQYEAAKGR